MCLHIEQEIAVRVCVVTFYSTEQAGDINDAGRFFVLRQEVEPPVRKRLASSPDCPAVPVLYPR